MTDENWKDAGSYKVRVVKKDTVTYIEIEPTDDTKTLPEDKILENLIIDGEKWQRFKELLGELI